MLELFVFLVAVISLYVVPESSYWYIAAIFNASKSFSSFWHIQSVYVISGMLGLMRRQEFCSLAHLLQFSPCPLQEWSRVSYEEDSLDIYPFDEISTI